MTRPLIFLALILLSAPMIAVRADDSPKVIADFAVPDVAGRAFSLSQLKNKKAIVVLFLGTECPINQYFMPRLAELHAEFAGQGAQFVGLYANRQDSLAKVKAHAEKHQVPFPIIK